MKKLFLKAFRSLGYDVVRYSPAAAAGKPLTSGARGLDEISEANRDVINEDNCCLRCFRDEVSEADRDILRQIAAYTMTGIERQCALISTMRYLERRGIQGSVVECGVWRGGSSMAAALTLLQERKSIRDLYLFDTFEGMTPPSDVDQTVDGKLARTYLNNDPEKKGIWCVAGLEDVQRNMASTGYPSERVHYIKGPVEETIPAQSPKGPIALLRLDTDWYESTRHELDQLFPQLVPGGVLIVDDYGHWKGARKAVDEFLAEQPLAYYLHRIDYTGRMLLK